jgi:5-methylcytosine-specific restriction endonuclease McrA
MSIMPLIAYANRFPSSFCTHARRLHDDLAYRVEWHSFACNMPYDEWLQTEVWKLTRRLLLIYQPCCVRCGSRFNLEVHHLTYERLGLEIMHLGDVEVLCDACHGRSSTPPRHNAAQCALCHHALWLPGPMQLALTYHVNPGPGSFQQRRT